MRSTRSAPNLNLIPSTNPTWWFPVGTIGNTLLSGIGKAIASFKTAFRAVLKAAKVPEVRDGMARTIYSLRHFYATQRLSHDASPFLLAKQMGTSVEMLEKFYGQTVTSAVAAQITKGKNSVSKPAESDYPFE